MDLTKVLHPSKKKKKKLKIYMMNNVFFLMHCGNMVEISMQTTNWVNAKRNIFIHVWHQSILIYENMHMKMWIMSVSFWNLMSRRR